MPWPGNTSAVGSGATIASPSATSVSPTCTRTCTTRLPADDADPRGLEVEQRAERHRREERHAPVAQQRGIAAAERVDDERARPRGRPRAVHDRPREPRHPRREHRAMQRVAIPTDARERLHRRGRRVLGLGERLRGPRVPLGAAGEQREAPRRDGRGEPRAATGSRPSVAAGGVARRGGVGRARGRRSRRSARRRARPCRVAVQRGCAAVRDVDGRLRAHVQDVAGRRARSVRRSHGCAARKSASPGSASVSVRSWRSRRRSAKAVAGASPRIASSASTSASVPRGAGQAGVAAQAGRRARGVGELDEPRLGVPGLARARRPRLAGLDRVRRVDELGQPRRERREREQRRERGPGERERDVDRHAVVRRAGRRPVRARRARPSTSTAS